jgi:uncharacterized membrane protein
MWCMCAGLQGADMGLLLYGTVDLTNCALIDDCPCMAKQAEIVKHQQQHSLTPLYAVHVYVCRVLSWGCCCMGQWT